MTVVKLLKCVLLDVTEEYELSVLCLIFDTLKDADASASVSSSNTSSCAPVFVTEASSLTESVSSVATTGSFMPVIVIVIFAVSDPLFPSETS